jgi:hypothetical protein
MIHVNLSFIINTCFFMIWNFHVLNTKVIEINLNTHFPFLSVVNYAFSPAYIVKYVMVM